MRVMLFSDTYPPQQNGVAISVRTLAMTLERHGHDVAVYSVRTQRRLGPPVCDAFPVRRVPVVPVPFYPELGIASPRSSGLLRTVDTFQPDLIHCHTPFGVGCQALRAGRYLGIPVVGTHHTFYNSYVGAYVSFGRRFTERLTEQMRRYVAGFYDRCDVLTCASVSLKDELAASGLRRNIEIVPNSVDTSVFQPAPRTLTQHAEAPLRLIYVGRLASEKNLLRLLELVTPALRRHPGMRLDLVGRGPLEHDLTAAITLAGLSEQVRLVGAISSRTALAAFIAEHDVCVTASVTENQPLSLLECLACGLPVVALAGGGIPEIVCDGENGFLVDPADNSEQFAHRLEKLEADRHLLCTMARGAVSIARTYAEDASLSPLLQAYEQAIAGTRVRAAVG